MVPTTAVNPLRIDPTRTASLRRRLGIELRKRLRMLNAAVQALVLETDAFAVASAGGSFEQLLKRMERGNTAQQAKLLSGWSFLRETDKLRKFKEWLAGQIASIVLSDEAKAVYGKLIREAFIKGASRAYDDAQVAKRKNRKKGSKSKTGLPGTADFQSGFEAGGKEEFMRRLLPPVINSAITVNEPVMPQVALDLILSMTFENLAGITAAMSTKIVSALAVGMASGHSPYIIAKQIAKDTGVDIKRAEKLARTSVIKAYAEATLYSLEASGITEVGAEVEFLSTPDGKRCPICFSLQGKVYKVQDAHGIIPVHPS